LKRQYGTTVIFSYLDNSSVDYESGAVNRVYTNVTIKRAIALPDALKSMFDYKGIETQFAHGGFFDKSVRVFIILKKDFATIVPTTEDYITTDSKTYKILQISEYGNKAYKIITEYVLNAPELGGS